MNGGNSIKEKHKIITGVQMSNKNVWMIWCYGLHFIINFYALFVICFFRYVYELIQNIYFVLHHTVERPGLSTFNL